MKIFTIAILFFLSCANTLWSQNVLIYGSISQPTKQEIKLIIPNNDLLESEEQIVTDLVDGNEFYFQIPINHLQMLSLQYGIQSVYFYVEPDDKIKIDFESYNPAGTAKFSGNGASKNVFYQKFNQTFYGENERMYIPNDHFFYFVSFSTLNKANEQPDVISAMRTMEANRQEKLRFVENARSTNTISGTFYELMKKNVAYQNATNMLGFLRWNKDLFAQKIWTIPGNYFDFLNQTPLDESMLADNNYKYFIAALLDHRNDFAEGKTLNQKQQFYNNIGKNLAGKTKYYFQGKYLIKALKNKEFDLFEINFADFSRENPYYEYTDALQEVYGYHARLSNGAVAPDFLASDTKGSMHNLQDYRGKVVYLSFWASWCQPCIENFKQTYHLKEELEREGVLFVNVSLDKENNTWETALRQYPIEGINLLANNKDEINRLYGFSTIPAYFLIDKNGKFRIIDNVRLDYAYDTVLRLTNE